MNVFHLRFSLVVSVKVSGELLMQTYWWPLSDHWSMQPTSPHLSGFVFYGCLESLTELSALCWGPKWPKSWPSEAHILHTTKSTCNEHVKQYWCQTSENFLRKWPKTGIVTYFGVENGPKIGPLSPIFYTHLKVITMSMWNSTDVNPLETVWENDQRPQF